MEGHIVITGATGIIGVEVARRLVESGRMVVVFARSPEAAAAKIPGTAACVRWDSDMEGGEWVQYMDGASAVIHLAGKPLLEARWTEGHKAACYDSRIKGTRILVSAMAKAARKPGVLVSSSAIGYYGAFESSDGVPCFTESGAPGSDFLARICYDWEREALVAERFGIRVVLLRTGIVLSTKGGMLQQMMGPFSYFLGGPVGSGKQSVSWIHLDDEVAVILEALDNPLYKGPVNAVAPEPVSMKEFASALGEAIGRPSLLSVPKFAVQLLLGEGAEYAVKGQKVLPGFLLKQKFVFSWPHLSPALKDLTAKGK